MKKMLIDDKAVVVRGRLLKTAKLQDEYFVALEDPEKFIAGVQSSGINADLLTFVQEVHERTPRYPFFHECDSLAVLPLGTYENWLNKQIGFKPRNKIRKAAKNGVEVKRVEFNDALVKDIMHVYNESPVRQGQRNRHYGKDFETVKREHSTFLNNSEFVGAFWQSQMIGFAKVTHVKNYSVLMNIVAMISHRDKAPTNGLIAKVVELCAARKIQYLNYSTWGKREGLNEFKEAHGFQRFEIPRYFVPLTLRGRVALRLQLHRKPTDYLPATWIERAAGWRSKWNTFRFSHSGAGSPNRSANSIAP